MRRKSVYLNKGKNPQMANTMQTTLQAGMLKARIACNIKVVNDAILGDGTMSDTMAVQMLVMPLFMMSMICSILVSLLFWHKDVTGLRKKSRPQAAAAQAVFVAALSAVVAGLALFVDAVAGGLSLPLGPLFLLCWGSSFCCMLCFVGLCDIALLLGALAAIGTFALGMGTAKISEASAKLASGTQAMREGVDQAISEIQGSIDGKLDLISAVRDYANSKGAFCGNSSDMPASTTFTVTAKADA